MVHINFTRVGFKVWQNKFLQWLIENSTSSLVETQCHLTKLDDEDFSRPLRRKPSGTDWLSQNIAGLGGWHASFVFRGRAFVDIAHLASQWNLARNMNSQTRYCKRAFGEFHHFEVDSNVGDWSLQWAQMIILVMIPMMQDVCDIEQSIVVIDSRAPNVCFR